MRAVAQADSVALRLCESPTTSKSKPRPAPGTVETPEPHRDAVARLKLGACEDNDHGLFITTHKNLRYQQNLPVKLPSRCSMRSIAISSSTDDTGHMVPTDAG
jgi:hypothetical protein